MKITTKKFGELNIDSQNIIIFKNGLFAFENLKKYILLDIKENIAFKWLQSIENTELAFLVVDPFLVKTEYFVDLDDKLQEELKIEKKEDIVIYTIVTVPQTGLKDATTNLTGPLIINYKDKKGKQILIEDEKIITKYPLVNKTKKASCGD